MGGNEQNVIEVVASDLDGTLVRSDGTVCERTRNALAGIERAGILFVICTARPHRWLKPLSAATGHRGVALCSNGSIAWDLHTESVLEARLLAPALTAEVVERMGSALPGSAWAVERVSGFAHEPAYVSHWPDASETIIADIDTLVSEPAVKLVLRHPSLLADELVEIARQEIGQLVEVTHSNSNDGLLEMSGLGVNKATALERFCIERGIGPESVIAFGDMPNDLAMLRWAGHGVAVANAHADLLAAADEITGTNDEAGVAQVLERLLSS